jgi:tRNA A37 threonylcarbamoyladenosine biosynthesis protein TsaE
MARRTTSDNMQGMDGSSIASPASTGGAGTAFEQHVDAYLLGQLLVGGIPPILHDSIVEEVHLQTNHLGWHTDDFLVIAQNGTETRRKLVGQVKRSFTVSATDDECSKAVEDFWKDFNNDQLFSPADDRFALVVLRGTNVLLENFSGLLDCARASRDAADFEHRLSVKGFLSTKTKGYCEELQAIISKLEGRDVSPADIWPFLRLLHVLSLDLNTSTRQSEVSLLSLLAYTSSCQDQVGAARDTWNALLREVGEGMPEARSYSRRELPQELLQRHSVMAVQERVVLRALSDHSSTIVDGIRSTIGEDLHLDRGALVQQIIQSLESEQVVLVTGTAGSGKSGVAKDAISTLAVDHFVFSFRAEEFAQPHFDATLHSGNIQTSAANLSAILAGQTRKIILVESVERLLEKPTRDAFTDLLRLVKRDGSWRLVITCRDYSSDTVRDSLLRAVGLQHGVVVVPSLDDCELGQVESTYPALARPLADATLRQLFRNPYVLDKALAIQWPEDGPLPQSERDFRMLFWREIIRADHCAGGRMPHRREAVFVEIALRRARALAPYAQCADLDGDAIEQLIHDSLVTSPHDNHLLLAPAHDVLEDWAILRWVDEQYTIYTGAINDFTAVLGTYPAIRRTYRKWVSEFVARDPEGSDELFHAVMVTDSLPAQFRDDTLASLLRSPASAAFLTRHRAELFVNGKQLLRRVIHLLRVACVTTPDWVGTKSGMSTFNVPEGLAWACVLDLIQKNLQEFGEADRPLLIGLIEDWVRGVAWWNPYPDGYDSVAAIAHWLLQYLDDYRFDDERKRVLQVIVKIPNGDRERFATLLTGRKNGNERDRMSDELRKLIFEGIEGMPVARDMPELVIEVARDYLLCTERELQSRYGFHGAGEIEVLFGIHANRDFGHFPASAYRGPFLPLLRHHPKLGIDFIVEVFNHSANWYAHPRLNVEFVEAPTETRLTFADGSLHTQWCNERLWCMYRGTSVSPNVSTGIEN